MNLQKIKSLYKDKEVTLSKVVLSGSRSYNLNKDTSDYDMLGIHRISTEECLVHPQFRKSQEVIRKQIDTNISLDSFEVWKFITIFLKGAPATYELIFSNAVEENTKDKELLTACREGITSKLGYSAKGLVLKRWKKDQTSLKKTVFAYYRLLQAIYFLKTKEFIISAKQIFEIEKLNHLRDILDLYLNNDSNISKIPDKIAINTSLEVFTLLDKLDKALIVTTLQDRVPKSVLNYILQLDKEIRLSLGEIK